MVLKFHRGQWIINFRSWIGFRVFPAGRNHRCCPGWFDHSIRGRFRKIFSQQNQSIPYFATYNNTGHSTVTPLILLISTSINIPMECPVLGISNVTLESQWGESRLLFQNVNHPILRHRKDVKDTPCFFLHGNVLCKNAAPETS